MNSFQIERALVVGWSIGVSVAYEVASQHRDRVAGLLSVCGLPDTSIGSIGHPLGVPSVVGQEVTSGALSALQALPSPILELVNRIPVTPTTVAVLRHSGFLSARADPETVEAALNYYLAHDPQWYLTLAKSAAEHQPPDLSDVACPAEFLAARSDVFLSPALVAASVTQLPNTTLQVVDGSHFLPLERPELIKQSLSQLANQAGFTSAE
jgi:pimeloyl-ACP methyl ester carboxylesterase